MCGEQDPWNVRTDNCDKIHMTATLPKRTAAFSRRINHCCAIGAVKVAAVFRDHSFYSCGSAVFEPPEPYTLRYRTIRKKHDRLMRAPHIVARAAREANLN